MIWTITVLTLVFVCSQAAIVRRQESCPLVCADIYKPICGSDGKTYSNPCTFHKAECMDSSLSMLYEGECGTTTTTFFCTTPYCWPDYDPVCGSDGVTYDNQCSLNNASCMRRELTLVHAGPCTSV